MKHVFTIISSTASARCLLSWRSDVSWLLCVSAPVEDHGDAGLHPLPHIALLHTAPMLPLPSFLLPAIAITTLSLSSRKEA
ncbi:unnamed protein product [Brassica oleracea]|nr:unnamed protein product [Brassica oleracea]